MASSPSSSRSFVAARDANSPPTRAHSSISSRASGNDSLQASTSFTDWNRDAGYDPAVYSAGQSLASILNNPHSGKTSAYSSDGSWGSWFFSTPADVPDSTPSIPLKPIPEVTRADFQTYLGAVREPYNRFADVREHFNLERSNQESGAAPSDGGDEAIAQGEGLVACLREIPSLYFDEGFALEDGPTFQAACPYSSIPQNMMLQEKLSHYLDIIEVHLVKEIAARSDLFYEAQGQIEDLNTEILGACQQIHEFKGIVRLSQVHVVESAQCIQHLSQQRDSLLSLHQKLKLMSYVNQALGDLPLLIAAADCGGALDVIDVLQHLLESGELVGLHSFRHLGSRLATFMDSVNSMLAADFVRVAIHDTKDLESSVIVAKFKKRDITYIMNSKEDFLVEENRESEDDEAGLRDQLLPLVIGLLRTSKLPEILRVYRDTLITDIKAAIKVVVAELLSVLIVRPIDTDTQSNERQTDLESGGVSLASKLRSLSAESFVQLLTGVFDVIQVRLLRAAEIRKIIEQIIGGLQGSYAEAAVAAAFASGAAVAAAAEAAQEDQMEPAVTVQFEKASSYRGSSFGKGMEAPSPTTISRNFRADVLRENTEAVCLACHAAHERWSKLLGVRAVIHPKLRLQEFVTIHNITQVFMVATEKIGGRYAPSIRGMLQSQSKAFVDVQHSMRMSKIGAVLEQETWASIDAPDEFQAIVDMLTHGEQSNNGILYSEQSTDVNDNEDPDNAQMATNAKSDAVVSFKQNDKTNGAEKVQGAPPPQNGLTKEPLAKSKKSRDKSTAKTLQIRGVGFHMVNSGLILLKMISEYIDISIALPSLAAEVVHRVAELLKLFNARTCQLVLGAGAMQVSGLKSITAKHLALASQSISFFHLLIADLKQLLAGYLPETRKALLFTEIDRVAQDYKVHKDEIHLKLVQIMKERLLAHVRTVPQIAEAWSRSEDQDPQPSQFARGLTKEVGVLHRVLSPLLLEADVRYIFTQVVALFHSQLAEAFAKLDLSSPAVKQRLYYDIQHILSCMRGLPSDNLDSNGVQKPAELDEFLQQRFGSDTPD